MQNQNAKSIIQLGEGISIPRVGIYLKRAGFNEVLALERYNYDARLASAFLIPLRMLEVTIRNAIDRSLRNKHGDEWFFASAYKDIVRNASNKRFTEDKYRSLKAYENGRLEHARGAVVSDLSFGFWRKMIHTHHSDVWFTELGNAFPHYGPAKGDILIEDELEDALEKLQRKLRSINELRNRVAHHEPIFNKGNKALREYHSDILTVTRWISPVAGEWARTHSEVHAIMKGDPRRFRKP